MVHDLDAGTEILRVAVPTGASVHDWDLQADGKVALAVGPYHQRVGA